MELSTQEIKLLIAVINKCTYPFAESKVIVPLAERLLQLLASREAEVINSK